MLKRTAMLPVAACVVSAHAHENVQKPDRFAPLRFFAGPWRGDQAGEPGQGTAERTYRFILNDRFLQETNTSTTRRRKRTKRGRSTIT